MEPIRFHDGLIGGGFKGGCNEGANYYIKWYVQAEIRSFVRPRVLPKATKELSQIQCARLLPVACPASTLSLDYVVFYAINKVGLIII